MYVLTATALCVSLLASKAWAQEIPTLTVSRNGLQASTRGAADNFTGAVWVDGRFQGTGPARVSGGTVTFEPGARTAWHTHPLGQTLIISAGKGLVQQQGQPIHVVSPGDTVWIPPNVRHWHGATATTGMTHIAIAEALDGKVVDWQLQVGDEEYGKQP